MSEIKSSLTTDTRMETIVSHRASLPNGVLLLGAAALALPTMIAVARFNWTTEQGGHGPLVLITGIWLLLREAKKAPRGQMPARPILTAMATAAFLLIYAIAHVTGILEIGAFSMYGAFLCGSYILFGGRFLRAIWFPLCYLAFTLPPPDTAVAWVTQPIKIWLSSASVNLLHAAGYPIASSGVMIQIAQYEVLVAAACAGLNSIISLAAICLFYTYLRHGSRISPVLIMTLFVIPIAVISNFIRIIILILVTYYFGESAAQGFIHDFAGLLMFTVALVACFGIDWLYHTLRRSMKSP